ncbi:MAG: hypothetical protein MUC28_02915 [Planctomycetes bacterium]|jgi:hypothetical protein|nr:hypothetical protein [Planctomycetota bacterium]
MAFRKTPQARRRLPADMVAIMVLAQETEDKVRFLEPVAGSSGAWEVLEKKFPGAAFVRQHKEAERTREAAVNVIKAVAYDKTIGLIGQRKF